MTANRTQIGLSGFLLLVSVVSLAQPVIDSLARQRLQILLNELQNSSIVRHGTVALSIQRTLDGQRILDYNAHMSLPSASTLKLVTTATALAVLGESYNYQTYLEYDGVIQNGVLTGNLYLRGSGDPSLASNRFAKLADEPTLLRTWTDIVQAAGIQRIRGSVIGDATAIQTLPVPDTWVWGDIGNYYGAGLSGLNFNENHYRIVFQPAQTVGQAAKILRTEPAIPFLKLLNRVHTGPKGSGDQVIVYNAPFSPQVYLEGTVPIGPSEFSVKGSLPDPAYYAAFALQQQLIQSGITVSGTPLSIGPGSMVSGNEAPIGDKRTLLHLHTSAPISELIRLTNHQSINLYAEAFLISTGNVLAKRLVHVDEAIEKTIQFWRSKQVNMSGFRTKDGSGLSPIGTLTATNLTGILTAMTKEKEFLLFYDSIPVIGESGTVKNLGRHTLAAGNVRAKSGTIEGVRAYAGYATSSDGELLSFAFLINNYQPGSQRIITTYLERIMDHLTTLHIKQ